MAVTLKLFTVHMMMWAQIKGKDTYTYLKVNNSLEYSHIIPCAWLPHTINKYATS